VGTFLITELVHQRHRSRVSSVVGLLALLTVIVYNFSLLPLFDWIGAYAFLLLYSGPCAFSCLFLYRCLPETRGREVHDVVAEMRARWGGEPHLVEGKCEAEEKEGKSLDAVVLRIDRICHTEREEL
jgi:Sugar (and other) transporter